jgi:pimeloyl-ACP methyl ester carboxylesterase
MGRGLLHWLGRLARFFLLTMLVLMGSGALYEAIASRGDAQRFAAPGQLVEVDGHLMHLDVQGSGGPTVVLEAGLGEMSVDWRLVQPELATFSRVVAYDRAGLGWSEPGPQPRTAARIADELHAALHNAGVPGPYVLVGHSIGAKNARMFAARYPDETAGLVLVDGRSEDMDAFYGVEGMQSDLTKMRIMYAVFGFLDRIGVVRLFGPELMSGQSAGMAALGPEHLAVYAHFAGRSSTAETSLAEYMAWQQSNAELTQAGTSLGGLPLVVLTHGEPMPTEAEEAAWQAAQARQASLSTAGRLQVAERSGHGIPLEQPELVLAAVREVVLASGAR